MLYRHFESKQELCAALLDRHRDALMAAPLAVFDPEAGDSRGQLMAMIGAWLEHAHTHPAATRMLFVPITGDAEVEWVQRARRWSGCSASCMRVGGQRRSRCSA